MSEKTVETRKKRHGSDCMVKAGRTGGEATLREHGVEHFRKLGKISAVRNAAIRAFRQREAARKQAKLERPE